MAVIDVAGFVADLKSHAIDHGFHVHDERHFVETYSLRQLWEVDLHPEEACNGPIDLHLSLEVDPRALLGFEDEVIKMDDPDDDPPTGFAFPLLFTWTLPPLPQPPDLLVLATEVSAVGGVDLSDTGYFGGLGVDYAVTDRIGVGGELLQHSFDEKFERPQWYLDQVAACFKPMENALHKMAPSQSAAAQSQRQRCLPRAPHRLSSACDYDKSSPSRLSLSAPAYS